MTKRPGIILDEKTGIVFFYINIYTKSNETKMQYLGGELKC